MEALDLPEKFRDLATWSPDWVLDTEKSRHVKRVSSDLDVVRGFVAAVFPRMDDIIRHLNTRNTLDPKQLAVSDRNLYYLAATCIEMSHPVDMEWHTTDIDDKFPSERMTIHDVPGR